MDSSTPFANKRKREKNQAFKSTQKTNTNFPGGGRTNRLIQLTTVSHRIRWKRDEPRASIDSRCGGGRTPALVYSDQNLIHYIVLSLVQLCAVGGECVCGCGFVPCQIVFRTRGVTKVQTLKRLSNTSFFILDVLLRPSSHPLKQLCTIVCNK